MIYHFNGNDIDAIIPLFVGEKLVHLNRMR